MEMTTINILSNSNSEEKKEFSLINIYGSTVYCPQNLIKGKFSMTSKKLGRIVPFFLSVIGGKCVGGPTCEDCPSPGVIVDNVILRLPQRGGLDCTPNNHQTK